MTHWKRGRADHIRRKISTAIKATEPSCWLCGRPIDPNLTWPHPFSFSIDHVQPVIIRPDLEYVASNCRASHLRCNQKRGDGRRHRPNRRPVQAFTIQGQP